jgi:hypothetical protein
MCAAASACCLFLGAPLIRLCSRAARLSGTSRPGSLGLSGTSRPGSLGLSGLGSLRPRRMNPPRRPCETIWEALASGGLASLAPESGDRNIARTCALPVTTHKTAFVLDNKVESPDDQAHDHQPQTIVIVATSIEPPPSSPRRIAPVRLIPRWRAQLNFPNMHDYVQLSLAPVIYVLRIMSII